MSIVFCGVIFCGSSALADISVNPQTGAANSFYRFEVPAHFGLDPRIELSYSGRGNGVAGAGWQLVAGSSLSRVSRHGVLPTWNNSRDLFLLDGQELKECGAIAPWSGHGNTHCLKVNNTLRIVFNAGLDEWTVTRTDGTVLTYASQWRVTTPAGVKTLRWAIRRARDVLGHEALYSYACDDGVRLNPAPAGGCLDPQDVVLSRVDYGAGLYGVELRYETGRPDVASFATGSINGLGQRRYLLKVVGVQMKNVGDAQYRPERAYQLTYAVSRNNRRSLLNGVQQFGRDAVITEGSVTMPGDSKKTTVRELD